MPNIELNDLDEIRQLIGRYCVTLDERDFDGVASCFTDDVESSYSGMPLEPGLENLMKFIDGVQLTVLTHHTLTPMTIDLDGDSATSMSYGTAVVLREEEGETYATVRGLRYADRLIKTVSGWKIHHRVQTAEWSFTVPATAEPGALWSANPDISSASRD